jgi:hypothetical protein
MPVAGNRFVMGLPQGPGNEQELQGRAYVVACEAAEYRGTCPGSQGVWEALSAPPAVGWLVQAPVPARRERFPVVQRSKHHCPPCPAEHLRHTLPTSTSRLLLPLRRPPHYSHQCAPRSILSEIQFYCTKATPRGFEASIYTRASPTRLVPMRSRTRP